MELVADDPTYQIELKAFDCEIINDHDVLKDKEEAYQPISEIRKITTSMVVMLGLDFFERLQRFL